MNVSVLNNGEEKLVFVKKVKKMMMVVGMMMSISVSKFSWNIQMRTMHTKYKMMMITMFEDEQVNIKVNKTRNCQGFPERRKGRMINKNGWSGEI